VDMPLNRGRRDVPSRPDIVASGPKTRQTAAQVRKLLAELMTRGPFDAVHHLSRGKGWRYFDKEMYMIRLHRDVEYLTAEVPHDRRNHRSQSFPNGPFQDGSPILGAKDKVIANFIRCVSGVCSFTHSKRIITHRVNEYKGKAAAFGWLPFPSRLKPGVPREH